MHRWKRGLVGGVLCLAVGLTLGFVSDARSQRAVPGASGPLKKEIATLTMVAEDDVEKVLKQLGPTLAARLARGEQVELPGLGTFRVVRVPEHKDMIDGRPGVIAAYNYVEFLPVQEVVKASNAPGAVPAVTVPAFEYVPLPNQVKGQKITNTRSPNTRVP